METQIKITKKLDHPFFVASLQSDGIVHFEMKDVGDYTVEIVDAQTNVLLEFGKGKKLPIMLSFVSFCTPNEVTMKYASLDKNVRYTKSNAIVVDSLWLRLAAHFYLNFIKPNVPTKLFDSTEEAIKWLKK